MKQYEAEMEQAVCGAVERAGTDLEKVCRAIYENPEIGFTETAASAALADLLERNGFAVRLGAGEMPTAFRAEYDSGKPGAVIAFLCEYDALPGMGHACGHNLIAVASAGAGIAARQAAERFGGKIVVLGTPAEEGNGGGKPRMLDAGELRDVDCALMMHPSRFTCVEGRTLANNSFVFSFQGKSAHAGACPWLGRSALDAVMQTYLSVNMLRGTLKDGVRINAIILEGGENQGTIPERCSIRYCNRAASRAYLDEMNARIGQCAKAAAEACGCTLTVEEIGIGYDELVNSPTLERLMQKNLALVGANPVPMPAEEGPSTLDMGNVSLRMPGFHGMFGIGTEAAWHTEAFRQAAGTEAAFQAALAAAKGMALTAADLLADPALVFEARSQFHDMIDKSRGTAV